MIFLYKKTCIYLLSGADILEPIIVYLSLSHQLLPIVEVIFLKYIVFGGKVKKLSTHFLHGMVLPRNLHFSSCYPRRVYKK